MENLTDFDFYLKFTKPLILNLPQINDRVLAAAWVKRLVSAGDTDEKLKLDYLKLLLFMLQRKKLTKPFTQHPSALEVFEPFPPDQTLVDVAKDILEKEKNDKQKDKMKRLLGDQGSLQPYISDFSADLLEYVAIQTIEAFGVHGYYAVSKEPLNSWFRVDKQLLPKAAKSMLQVSVPPSTLTEARSSPELSEKGKPVDKTPEQQPPMEVPPFESPKTRESLEITDLEFTPPPEPSKKSPKKSPLGATPPSRPIGTVSPPAEDRNPPTWGSNLLEAKFLDENLEDIVKDATNLEEFLSPTASTGVAGAPMEVLWSSPSSPFFTGDDMEGLDISMPDILETSIIGEAGSPRQPSPQQRQPSPPRQQTRPAPKREPSRPKRLQPPKLQAKSTRSAELLQKKKEKDAAKAKAPSPWRASRDKALKAIKAEKTAKLAKKKKADAADPLKASPGETFRGFEGDDVDSYIAEYNRTLQALEDQYQQELTRQRQEVNVGAAEVGAARAPSPSRRPQSSLARRSSPRIPKDHDISIALDQSIHLSPEARQLLREVAEGPTTAAGITSPRKSLSPKIYAKEEEEFFEEVEAEPETATRSTVPQYATTEAPPGFPSKDPRLVATYNQILETSMKVEEDEADFDMDLGNVSGRDLDAVVEHMEAAMQQQSPEYDYDDFEAMERMVEEEMRAKGEDPHAPQYDFDDFEAMERMVEEEMRAKGQDPHAKPPKLPMTKKEFRKGQRQFLRVHHKAEAQMDELEGWQAAPQYFEDADKQRFAQMTTPERIQHEFGDLEVIGLEDDEEDILPDDIGESLSPGRKMLYQDYRMMYEDYYNISPAAHDVPTTAPRPTVCPQRLKPRDPDWKIRYRFPPAGSRLRPLELPDSPPVHPDELLVIPTSPSQFTGPLQPLNQLEWESPERRHEPLQVAPPPPDTSAVSPKSKTWAFDLMDLHEKLHPPSGIPDLFDIPANKMDYESPPKGWASPPISPVLSPPIDPEALKSKVLRNARAPNEYKYYHAAGTGHIGRHSRVSSFQRVPIVEPDYELTEEEMDFKDELAQFQLPSKERRVYKKPFDGPLPLRGKKTPDLQPISDWCESPASDISDTLFPDDLLKSPKTPPQSPINWEELGLEFSSGIAGSFIYRRDVSESTDGEESVNVVTAERAPEDFVIPEGPEFRATPPISDSPVQYPSSTPRAREVMGRGLPEEEEIVRMLRQEKYKKAGRRLNFDRPRKRRIDLDEEEQFLLEQGTPPIEAISPGLPEDEAAMDTTPITTRPLGGDLRRGRIEEIEMDLPESPHTPATTPEIDFRMMEANLGLVETPEARPRRPPRWNRAERLEEPRERKITRKLAKKRLDFESVQEPETHVEMTDLTTRIKEQPPIHAGLVDEFIRPEGYYMVATGDERSPEPFNLESEEMPLVENLDEFGPPSPSLPGVMEMMKDELRRHVMGSQKPTTRHEKVFYRAHPKAKHAYKYRDFYKRHPWRQLPPVAEQPMREHLARIHDIAEAEAEEDLRAAAVAHPRTPPRPPPGLDYATPPELQLLPIPQRPNLERKGELKSLFYSGKEHPMLSVQEQEELAEFERLERQIGGGSPVVLQVTSEPDWRLGLVYGKEDAQYEMLKTPPPKSPSTPPWPTQRLKQRTFQTLQELVEYQRAQPPSPGYYEEQERARQRELEELEARQKAEEERRAAKVFEYQQKIKEQKAAAPSKGVKGKVVKGRAMAMATRKPSDKVAKKKEPPPPPPKPKRSKRWKGVSKLDTGRGAAAKKPPAKEAQPAPAPPPRALSPVMELNIDLAGLQELGLNAADLSPIILSDAVLERVGRPKRIHEAYQYSDRPIDEEEFPEMADFADFDEPPETDLQAEEFLDPETGILTRNMTIRGTTGIDGERPSILGVVSPTAGLNPAEQAAIMDAAREPRSPDADDYSWGGASPMPEELKGFKWMTASAVPEQWPPWDDEY